MSNTSVDFKVNHGQFCFLIELVSPEEGEYTKVHYFESSTEEGIKIDKYSADGKDMAQDVIRCQDRIMDKVVGPKGNCIKFPNTSDEKSVHIIALNPECYLNSAFDEHDFKMIAYGNEGVTEHYGLPGNIIGLFDARHPKDKSEILRDRIHGIMFFHRKIEPVNPSSQHLILIENRNFSNAETFRRALLNAMRINVAGDLDFL